MYTEYYLLQNRNLMYDLDGNRIEYRRKIVRTHRNVMPSSALPPIHPEAMNHSRVLAGNRAPSVISAGSHSRRNKVVPLTPRKIEHIYA